MIAEPEESLTIDNAIERKRISCQSLLMELKSFSCVQNQKKGKYFHGGDFGFSEKNAATENLSLRYFIFISDENDVVSASWRNEEGTEPSQTQKYFFFFFFFS